MGIFIPLCSLFYHNGHRGIRKGFTGLDSALRASVFFPACGRQVGILGGLLSPQRDVITLFNSEYNICKSTS